MWYILGPLDCHISEKTVIDVGKGMFPMTTFTYTRAAVKFNEGNSSVTKIR